MFFAAIFTCGVHLLSVSPRPQSSSKWYPSILFVLGAGYGFLRIPLTGDVASNKLHLDPFLRAYFCVVGCKYVLAKSI